MTPLYGEAKAAVTKFEADRRSGAAGVRAATAQRDEAAEERANTGMLVPIEVGCTVWTDPAKLRGADDEIAQQDGSMSGIVLAVFGNVELGEMVRAYNPFTRRPDKRFQRWQVADLDLWRTERTDPHKLARYWRRLHRLIAEGEGLPVEQEATIAADAQRLLRVLMTEGGRK